MLEIQITFYVGFNGEKIFYCVIRRLHYILTSIFSNLHHLHFFIRPGMMLCRNMPQNFMRWQHTCLNDFSNAVLLAYLDHSSWYIMHGSQIERVKDPTSLSAAWHPIYLSQTPKRHIHRRIVQRQNFDEMKEPLVVSWGWQAPR